MNDIQDLKQLVENVKTNINNDNEKYNKDFSYNNNGSLISIILKRFMKENITEEIESQIINNNIKAEKEIKKIDKLSNFVISIFFISILPTLFFTFSFIISRFTAIRDFSNDSIVTLFTLSFSVTFFSVTFFSVCLGFFLFCKIFKIEDKNKKNIYDKALLNYNNKILKIILTIIKDLNSIRNVENSKYIDLINKRLIEDAYLFENGKIEGYINGSLQNAIISNLLYLKSKTKKNIEDKIVKKEDLFKNVSLEEKIDFLKRKIT